ncbi:hypothetical protein ILYODFUR_032102, partial [Ilyodon furcidens]
EALHHTNKLLWSKTRCFSFIVQPLYVQKVLVCTHVLTETDVNVTTSVSWFKSVAKQSNLCSQNRPITSALTHHSTFEQSKPQVWELLMSACWDEVDQRVVRKSQSSPGDSMMCIL